MSTQSIEADTLDFVAATGQALAEAEKIASAHEAVGVKLASLAPTLAKQLVDLKIVDSTLEKDATERLKDPIKLAEIFDRVLKHVAKKASEKTASTKAGSELGQAVPPAATPVSNDNYTGRRKAPSEKSASDEPLLKLAGY